MNPTLSREGVGYLSDGEVSQAFDDLCAAAATPARTLMRRLFALGWRPVGMVPTLFYGQMVFLKAYNEVRDELNLTVEDAFSHAYGVMMNHPYMQQYAAMVAAAIIDQQAGV